MYDTFLSVTRSCGKDYDNTYCAQTDRLKEPNIELAGWLCSCDGDRCNSTHGLHIGASTVAIVSVIAAFVLNGLF